MEDLTEARSRFLAGEGDVAGVRPSVLAAWRRSVAHGVDPREQTTQVIEPGLLREARSRNGALIRDASPFLEIMHETLSHQPHLIALSDSEGLILETYVGPGLPGELVEGSELVPGASWHERELGSNGIGTCLAAGEPTLLMGPEHFHEAYVGWTCIGVPIRDEGGEVLGAVGLSMPNEEASAHAWGWTLSVARGIEAALARPFTGGRAEAELEVEAIDAPLQSVRGVLEGLISGGDLAPTHAGFVGEALDDLDRIEVGDLIRANRLMHRDRELLERLVEGIPVMVVIYDPEIREVRLNRHVERVLGWTNEDLQRVDIMDVCYPNPEYREQVRRYMASLEEGWRDFDMVAKDGSIARVSWANIRLTDSRQVGIGIDITARQEAEEELQRSFEETKRALAERDNILAVVSHDLRNPMSTVALASNLLRGADEHEKRQKHHAIIRRAVGQMERLIDDLMDAARIDGGGLVTDRETCSTGELVRLAVESHAPLAESESVSVVSGEVVDVEVLADRGRILQVLGNLISNAVEYSTPGSRVVVAVTDGEGGDGGVVFSVRDEGTGIRAEDLPRVFDRYWRAGPQSRTGAGLGLAIARGIVEAHGGEIRVESTEGVGSTFYVSLPLG